MNEKRQRQVAFQAQFEAKLIQLKNNGQKLQTLERLRIWLTDNIDHVFSKF